MHELSFTWPHPHIPSPVGEISVRVHTGENVYGLDPLRTDVETHEGVTTVTCQGLTWAGGQQLADGGVVLRISTDGAAVVISAAGSHADGVRSLAVTIHGLPTGPITGVREGTLDVPATGRIVTYPNGWHDLATPLMAIDHGDGTFTSARSADTSVREKRFAVVPRFDDPAVCDFDLIVDAAATQPSADFSCPDWYVERVTDLAPIYRRHAQHVQAAYDLPAWESRQDVPDWMRQKSLVVTMHGMHFTGRVFLDYAAMLDNLKRLAAGIDGSRILAYLPGWEGRYYRWYGRFGTDQGLGGDAGFQRLIDGAHELGVHVMPMFGMNFAARDLPGFESWGEPGQLMRASGGVPIGSVDWDGSRHYDHGWGAIINPAYQPWREKLAGQIVGLEHEFGFDAAFLDISAMYSNDPRGDTTQGLQLLVNAIRAGSPGLLISGEAWFDALGGITPLVQTGHREGLPVYHDEPDEELFTTSNRSFGHVCLGDPAHGSSGCHEAGYNREWRLPVREGVIPTLGLIEDTLDLAPERVALILDDARDYAAKFLS